MNGNSMTYQLNETDRVQFQILKEQVFLYYVEEDALKIDIIIERALLNGWIDKSDIYELIEVLPRIVSSLTNIESHVTIDSQNTDWNVYIDERRGKYKREVDRLYQLLSNWIFMHNVIYRKNVKSFENQNKKVMSINIGQGIKK
jgi:hypothetical protein